MNDKNPDWRTKLGMPTDVEFNRLRDAYPTPQIGDSYTDGEIEEVIKVDRNESRYRSVVSRWKRYLERSRNLLLKRDTMVGYSIANAEERFDISVDHRRRAYRQTRRATRILGSTNVADLPEELHPAYHHHLQAAQRAVQAEMEERRAIKMLPPRSVSDKK